MTKFYSDILVDLLISKNRIPYEVKKYRWSGDFIESLKTVKVDNLHMHIPFTLYTVFEMGLNIGACNLTSRHLMRLLNDYQNAKMIYGRCRALKGTKLYFKKSQFSHVWIEYSGSIIDTTLMLKMPKYFALNNLHYFEKKALAPESAAYFSDSDDYFDLIKVLSSDESIRNEYYDGLLKIR